jgi:predicted dinucleotide-binding enzyme
MVRVQELNRAVRTAVVGTGRIGDNAARSRSQWGHEAQIGVSRHPDRLVARAARLITQSADEARLPTDPKSPGLSSPASSVHAQGAEGRLSSVSIESSEAVVLSEGNARW